MVAIRLLYISFRINLNNLFATGNTQKASLVILKPDFVMISRNIPTGIPLSCFVRPVLGRRQSPIDTIGSRKRNVPPSLRNAR